MSVILKLIFGFCILVGKSNSECPSYAKSCDCSSDGMYDCSRRNLNVMVNDTEDDIRTLDMSHNSIKKTRVLEAPYLTYLSLANNLLKTVEYDTFDNLDELKTLVLSNNSISRITDDVFEWNPLKLEVLHLDGNQIEFIQHFLLYDLEQLTELYLQNNLIAFIHSHAFLQLKKLRVLRLENNHLHTFDSKWFKALKANMFESISLGDNPWSCDCAMTSSIPWLKKTKWFNHLVKNEDLQCTKPEHQRNTLIKDLVDPIQCDSPDIIGISENSTLFVGESIQLDCVVAKNKFPLPQIMWIAPDKDHYNLQTADRFEGIEVFQNGSLIIHHVQENDTGTYICVATANRTSIEATMKLVVKKLANGAPAISTKVKDIEETSDFHETTYDHRNDSCPASCSCVAQHIDCSSDDGQGEIIDIPIDAIPLKARTLTLSSNKIKKVPVFVKTYPDLTELRLDNNVIESIAPKAFDNLQNLQTLTIRDNKLSTLPKRPFKKLTKLTILVLDNNELTEIDDNTLFGLHELQWLYIRHNYIKQISQNAFAKLNAIRFMHLENNQLSTLAANTITSLTNPKKHSKSIQKIFVDNNLFSCDCNMEGLKIYLQQSHQFDHLFGDGIKCNFPPSLHGEFLRNVNTTLSCDEEQPKTILTFGGNAGGKPCNFPFEFESNIYSKCIQIAEKPFNSKVWCATTESYSKDTEWGECNTKDYTFVDLSTTNNDSGALSGLWFAGLIVGFILCGIIYFVYRKYGHRMGIRSMKYSNLPGHDEADEYRSLNSGGTSGSEAFV